MPFAGNVYINTYLSRSSSPSTQAPKNSKHDRSATTAKDDNAMQRPASTSIRQEEARNIHAGAIKTRLSEIVVSQKVYVYILLPVASPKLNDF